MARARLGFYQKKCFNLRRNSNQEESEGGESSFCLLLMNCLASRLRDFSLACVLRTIGATCFVVETAAGMVMVIATGEATPGTVFQVGTVCHCCGRGVGSVGARHAGTCGEPGRMPEGVV